MCCRRPRRGGCSFAWRHPPAASGVSLQTVSVLAVEAFREPQSPVWVWVIQYFGTLIVLPTTVLPSYVMVSSSRPANGSASV